MKSFIKIIVLSFVSIIALSSAVFGGAITKSFEIGEGTAQPFSHKRTFEIPCNTRVTAVISWARFGRPGADKDVPITISLMKPAFDGGEGEGYNVRKTATTSPQYSTIGGGSSLLGCNKTWSVRVQADDGSSGFTVKGEIRLEFDDTLYRLTFSDNYGKELEVGETAEFFISAFREESRSSEGGAPRRDNGQGVIEITGTWSHNLGLFPIQMFVQLLNPDGVPIAFDRGYSNNEINPCCKNDKLKMTFRFPEYVQGSWKIRIKNESAHTATNVRISGTYKPSCR